MKRRGGSQRDDESVGGAGDHGPGAGVDGVDVPLGHQPLVVPHPALHRHQRRHCEKRNQAPSQTASATQPNHPPREANPKPLRHHTHAPS
jgi:hypothetical protein